MKKPFDPKLTEVCVRREGFPPGMWLDGNGHIHVSVPEVLEHLHLPLTPENRAMVVKMAQELTRKNGLPSIYRSQPNPAPPLS